MRKATTIRGSNGQTTKTLTTVGRSSGPLNRASAPGARGTFGGTSQASSRRRAGLPADSNRTIARRPADGLSTISMPLGSDGFVVEKFTVAPSPSRDYYGLRVGKGQTDKCSEKCYPKKHALQTIFRVMSNRISLAFIVRDATLSEVLAVASGSSNTLATLPTKMLLQVLQYLSPREILRLAQVCRRLHEVCSNNDLWELVYKKYSRRPVGKDDRQLASMLGWRCLFHRRGFLAENSLATKKAQSQTNGASPRRKVSLPHQASTPRNSVVSIRSSAGSIHCSTRPEGRSGTSKSSIPRPS